MDLRFDAGLFCFRLIGTRGRVTCGEDLCAVISGGWGRAGVGAGAGGGRDVPLG